MVNMNIDNKEEQLCLYLSGIVQGVGMRQYVARQAKRLGVKGWVKNLPDGRVQCLAQAPSEILENFVEQLENARVGRVDHIKREQVEKPADYKNFTIEP